VRGQLPYEPRRLSHELRGVLPSLSAASRVSPETNELEGVATVARFAPGEEALALKRGAMAAGRRIFNKS